MFNVFKVIKQMLEWRSQMRHRKVEQWELDLLRNTLQKLPSEYHSFIRQIDDNLLIKVYYGLGFLPNWMTFGFNQEVIDKYDIPCEKEFFLTHIQIWDKISSKYLNYTIGCGGVTINGYSITGATEYVIDVTNINVDHFKRQTLFYEDYSKIEGSLTDFERDLLNPGDVYEIKLEGKTYYHLMDLADGDGDFIGMDLKKRVYLITHDPFGIKLLDKPLREILEKNLKAFANRD